MIFLSATAVSLFTVISACIVGTAFNRSCSASLPLVTCGIITIIYPFYCARLPYLGFWVVIAILFLLITYCIYKHKVPSFFSSTVPAFLILCVFLYFQTKNYSVQSLDETRLWGAVPKLLFYGKLPIGSNGWLSSDMQSYPPGISLFQFFAQRLTPNFYDSISAFAYVIFGATLFFPTIKEIKTRQWHRFLPIVTLVGFIYYLPLLIYNQTDYDYIIYYNTLSVDPLLGLLVAYCFFLVLLNPFKDTFSILQFCTALCVTVLIKDSGVLFAVFALTAALLQNFPLSHILSGSKQIGTKGIAKIVYRLLPIATVFITYFSWQAVLLQNKVYNRQTVSIFNVNGALIKNYILLLWRYQLNFLGSSLAPFGLIAIFAIYTSLFSAITYLAPKRQRTAHIIVFTSFLTACCMFITGYYIIASTSPVFAEHFASYGRYMGTLMLASSALLFMVFANRYLFGLSDFGTRGRYYIVGTVLILSILISVKDRPKPLSFLTESGTTSAERQLQSSHAQIPQDTIPTALAFYNTVGREIEIYMVTQRLSYALMQSRYTTPFNAVTIPPADGSDEDIIAAYTLFAEGLVEKGYEYLILYDFYKDFSAERGIVRQIFGDEMQLYGLYKIINTSNPPFFEAVT